MNYVIQSIISIACKNVQTKEIAIFALKSPCLQRALSYAKDNNSSLSYLVIVLHTFQNVIVASVERRGRKEVVIIL